MFLDNVGDIFYGQISSISSNDEFYVVEENAIDKIQINSDLINMWWYPCIYETFYVQMADDELFYRCIRLMVDVDLDPTNFMKLYLLDTGETFTIPISNLPNGAFYEMPEAIKKVPPLAMKCCINEIEVETSEDNFLLKNLFNKFTFEVMEIDHEKLYVNILPFMDELTCSEDESSSEEEEIVVELEALPSIKKEEDAITKEYFTKEELEMLEEKPLNTEDALVAVQGFHTKDDERICKFYDPQIGGCWKGGNCRMIHIHKTEDGTCRDKVFVYYNNIPTAFPFPQLYSNITIELTSFIQGSRFYCLYKKLKPRKSLPGITIEHLIDDMNSEEAVGRYQKMKFFPSYKQLLVVKLINGKFYRGRVEELADDDGLVDVLIVDLGIVEKVPLKFLYEWEPRFNYLEFQSVEMEIVNIKLPPNGSVQDIQSRVFEIMKKASTKYLKVTIFENITGIKCKLYDENDDDIGDILVNEGLALARAVDPPTVGDKIIPG